MSGSDKQLNTEKLHTYRGKCYCYMDNRFIHVLNMPNLQVCVTVLTKISNLTKWSCVLNVCSECPGLFVPDVEMNDEKYVGITFISFHHNENISSCSF